MHKKLKISGLLIVTIFCLQSCDTSAQSKKKENNTIQSVSVKNTFGRGGFVNITATKDSLISENKSIALKEIPNFRRKIDSKDWDLIVSNINMDEIKRTESGKSRGYYDGPDEIFEIAAQDQNYTLTNVIDSTKYKQLKNIKVLLKKLVLTKE